MTARLGGCQCGTIRYRASTLRDDAHVCHCRMCQKAGGNFFQAFVGVPLEAFEWTRGKPAAFQSSGDVLREFCQQCGTPLSYRHADNAHVSITLGTFDEPGSIALTAQLGVESKQSQVDTLAALKTCLTTDAEAGPAAQDARDSNRQHPDHHTTHWPTGGRQSLAHIALVVNDYDEAIEFFSRKLDFAVLEDTYQAEQDKRWVVVAPPGSRGTSLVLARASTPEQRAFVGNQAGGRVFLFMSTDDFQRDFNRLNERSVNFVREPKTMPYGKVAVFEDLYGNLWDLVQFSDGHHSA